MSGAWDSQVDAMADTIEQMVRSGKGEVSDFRQTANETIAKVGNSLPDNVRNSLHSRLNSRLDKLELEVNSRIDQAASIVAEESKQALDGAMMKFIQTMKGLPADELTQLFSLIDKDGDGTINQEEFGQFVSTTLPPGTVIPPAAIALGFQVLDTDRTGSLSISDILGTQGEIISTAAKIVTEEMIGQEKNDSSIESIFSQSIQQIGESSYMEGIHVETGEPIDGKWATWTLESVEERDGLYWVTASSKQQRIQNDEFNSRARFVLSGTSPDDLIEGHSWDNGEWMPHFSTGKMENLVFNPQISRDTESQKVESNEVSPTEEIIVEQKIESGTDIMDSETIVSKLSEARFSSEKTRIIDGMKGNTVEFEVSIKRIRTEAGPNRPMEVEVTSKDGMDYILSIDSSIENDKAVQKRNGTVQITGKVQGFNMARNCVIIEISDMRS